MRAGCFAERRVIDLINRRFVPFYFNRGGPGEGKDGAASAFVDRQTDNPYAYLAAFSPTGEILGETALYADKDEVFAWLQKLLEDHPEFATPTAIEREKLSAAGAEGDVAFETGLLLEELGDYDGALKSYALAPKSLPARLGELRIARYQSDWTAHESVEQTLRAASTQDSSKDSTGVHADLERGRRWLAQGKHEQARDLLQALSKRAAGHPRLAEVHFYAGVACWFDGDRAWAKLHWCWVAENLPEDRLKQRAFIAAAAEAMPYENPELGGFKADVGSIGTHHIQQGYRAAREVHRALLPSFEAGDLRASLPDESKEDLDDPDATAIDLAARLRDGNDHVPANNRIVERLVVMKESAIAPLMSQITDEDGLGRGYSAWALANVLIEVDSEQDAAHAALEAAAKDEDSYVSALANSGLRKLRAAPAGEEAGDESELPRSATQLVALLRDGNQHLSRNNKIVERLEALGDATLPTLIAASGDELFAGRGYSAWALSQVLKTSGSRPDGAMAALRAAAACDNSYVATLAKSGLTTL